METRGCCLIDRPISIAKSGANQGGGLRRPFRGPVPRRYRAKVVPFPDGCAHLRRNPGGGSVGAGIPPTPVIPVIGSARLRTERPSLGDAAPQPPIFADSGRRFPPSIPEDRVFPSVAGYLATPDLPPWHLLELQIHVVHRKPKNGSRPRYGKHLSCTTEEECRRVSRAGGLKVD